MSSTVSLTFYSQIKPTLLTFFLNLRWNDSFKVFYHGLDAEHKVLFDGVFNVNEKRGDKGTFDLAAKVGSIFLKVSFYENFRARSFSVVKRTLPA